MMRQGDERRKAKMLPRGKERLGEKNVASAC